MSECEKVLQKEDIFLASIPCLYSANIMIKFSMWAL